MDNIELDKPDNVIVIFNFIDENRELVKMIMEIKNPDFIQKLLDQTHIFLQQNRQINQLFCENSNPEMTEYALSFIFGGFQEILQRWIDADFTTPSSKLIELVHRFIVGTRFR